MRNFFIFQNQQRRTTNNKSYESVKNLGVLRPPRPVIPVAEGVRLKVEIRVKHAYFSIELSILKHLVVTVVNKKKERTKLWTKTRISEQAHNDHKN